MTFHTDGEYDRAGSRVSTPPVTSRSVPPSAADGERTAVLPRSIPGTDRGSAGPARSLQPASETASTTLTTAATPRPSRWRRALPGDCRSFAPASAGWSPPGSPMWGGGDPADLRELVAVQAGAADQGAVDVRLGDDAVGVGRLDRPAVEDADAVGEPTGVQLREPGPDLAAHLLRVLRRGDLAGADRPHRLVGDHDVSGLLGRDPGQVGVELGHAVRDVLPGLPHGQSLAHAQDRDQAMPERRPHLRVDQCVVLAVVLAPLGVADDGVPAAELAQH